MAGCESTTTRPSVAATVVDGDRFVMWSGRSGRRHVFSRVEPGAEAVDLDGAVVIVAVRTANGALRPLWIGNGAEAPLDGSVGGREVHVHWLAETTSDRARVIADLAPCVGPVLVAPAVVGSVPAGSATLRRDRVSGLARAA